MKCFTENLTQGYGRKFELGFSDEGRRKELYITILGELKSCWYVIKFNIGKLKYWFDKLRRSRHK